MRKVLDRRTKGLLWYGVSWRSVALGLRMVPVESVNGTSFRPFNRTPSARQSLVVYDLLVGSRVHCNIAMFFAMPLSAFEELQKSIYTMYTLVYKEAVDAGCPILCGIPATSVIFVFLKGARLPHILFVHRKWHSNARISCCALKKTIKPTTFPPTKCRKPPHL